MPNKMLIDASHPEETRVVVVRGNRIEEFDFESENKKQLKGNIYLARVTRVEPSLQAAFVEYGGNRHGFLAFSEIHPDYYQIPVADRQALLRADAEEAMAEDEEEEDNEERRNRRRRRGRARGRASDANASGDNNDNNDDDEAAQDTQVAASDDADTNDGDTNDSDADTGTGTGTGTGAVMAEAISAEIIAEDVPETSDDNDGDRQVDETATDTVEEVAASNDDDQSDDSHDDNGDDDHHDNENGNDDTDGNGGDEIVSVGAGDGLDDVHSHRRAPRKQYKIQEVIKRRQILLVQVVKEERGNKGAALTTYMSLAGRYSVLMPNTARGGGISRKITNAADRKRLKDVVKDLQVPQGMGVILRTAGESRTKAEIRRDYEYLMRMWDNVRELTLKSSAPALVYEEGSLIKRSVRDLYNKDINQILVAGEEGYREAKDFMRMLMPSHAKVVQPYRDTVPIFARSGIEGQLDRMVQPQVTLKSGGYIIINQTEALVAIDVNSGRSTKEHSIEDTALQTNLEAAEEVSRQLRLRDLAGLIVIDFIDMEENRNNRAVEKRLKDCLKNDRARIQVGRISHFGLLEMSRQRLRASVLESTMQVCSHCGGTGHVRSESSVALLVIRAIEEFLLKDSRHHITVRMPVSTAIYVLNHKRAILGDLESRFGLMITVEADDSVRTQHYVITKGAIAERPADFVPFVPQITEIAEIEDIEDVIEDEEDSEDEEATSQPATGSGNGEEEEDGHHKRKRRRRRRRGGRDNGGSDETPATDDASHDEDSEPSEENGDEAVAASSDEASPETGDAEDQPKKRRRGKRGGRRTRRDETSENVSAIAEDNTGSDVASEASAVVTAEIVTEAPDLLSDEAAQAAMEETPAPVVASPVAASEAESEADTPPAPEAAPKPKRAPRRTATKKAKEAEAEQQLVEPEVAEAVVALETEPAAESEAEAAAKPKRAPRRKTATKAATAKPAAEDVIEEAASEVAKEPKATPARAPRTRAKAKTPAVTETETASKPEAEETAPVVEPVVEASPAEPVAAPAEPVVTTNGEAVAKEEAKPRRGGWWQRKGFF